MNKQSAVSAGTLDPFSTEDLPRPYTPELDAVLASGQPIMEQLAYKLDLNPIDLPESNFEQDEDRHRGIVLGSAPGHLEPTATPGITGKENTVIVLICRSPRFDDVAAIAGKYGVVAIKDEERQKRGSKPALSRSHNLSRWSNKNRKVK